ncbi:MAG: HEAT repeat domain-containing protein [Deltaproteobacteria bacterium]|nr:HEAT repeat domain-containing protein [Deltaproteobacteria bacterium]
MATVKETQPRPSSPDTADEEWQAAENVLTSLQLARKNYSLYPEDHINCTRVMERFWQQLETFLQAYGNLRFELEKDRLIFQGEAILTEPPEDGNLPFTLFRDGIQWLEFQDGIEAKEIEEFLRILNKYRLLSDEPEGDLVTALWEAELPHIQHQVAEFFWGAEPEAEFKTPPAKEDISSVLSEEEEQEPSESEAVASIDPTTLELTPEEEAELQEMVRLEEKRDPTADYLNAVLDSLLELREKENFDPILESLEEEFHDSLARRDFEVTLKILKSLHHVRNICESETTWAIPIIDSFFLTASSSQSLRPLQAAWSEMDTGQIEKMKEILLVLEPEAIHTLGAMLLQTPSLRLQQMLTEVILSLASRDLRPLEAMLDRPEEDLVLKLVQVVGSLGGEKPIQVLSKMVHHSSARVRQAAVKGLLRRGTASIKELFHLIEDEDDSVRRLILHHMGQERNEASETLLLQYLEEGKIKGSDDKHIIACFRTLGRCGSPRSIPFLRQTLLGRGWMPDLRSSAYRQGAALALQAMRIKGAQQVLEDASRSLKPGVRRIARKVMQDQGHQSKE